MSFTYLEKWLEIVIAFNDFFSNLKVWKFSSQTLSFNSEYFLLKWIPGAGSWGGHGLESGSPGPALDGTAGQEQGAGGADPIRGGGYVSVSNAGISSGYQTVIYLFD